MSRRENTFRVDYANVPKKPSFEDVHKFIATKLGLKREDVLRIQCNRSMGCAFVKVRELAIAQKVVSEHDEKHEIEIEGKVFKIRILLEDGAVDVKLHDLSEDVSNATINKYLSAYGDILSIRELVWGDNFVFGGISTGVRVVKMRVENNIPSFISIDGENTYVSYYGQHQTCRHCNEFVHNGITCVQNKKLMVQKTYANVTKRTELHATMTKPSTTKILSTMSDLKSTTSKQTTTNAPPKPTPEITAAEIVKKGHKEQPIVLLAPQLPETIHFKMPAQRPPVTNTQYEDNDTDGSSTSTSNSTRRSHRKPTSKKLRTDEESDTMIVDN